MQVTHTGVTHTDVTHTGVRCPGSRHAQAFQKATRCHHATAPREGVTPWSNGRAAVLVQLWAGRLGARCGYAACWLQEGEVKQED